MSDTETPRQNLSGLEKAIASLEGLRQRVADEQFIKAQDQVVRLGLQAGLIQNLEFTYELCWKAINRWLENNLSPGVADGVTRRELFRMAAENRLIEDVDEWMVYHAARNQTSHQYDSAIAQEVLDQIGAFSLAAQRLLANLKARND
jgi:nucleotidyltransferase substrate binding protein (TIGR01987 family)